jgi:predicted adenylyl cyclase CyaB
MLRALKSLRRVNASKVAHLEVERKFALSNAQAHKLPAQISLLGFQHMGQVIMKDTFLPVLTEGDMMRVRDETTNETTCCILTRKSWVVIDGERERKELEESVDNIARGCLLELGERLNGSPLLSFTKARDFYHCLSDPQFKNVVVTIDNVEGLGQYSGFYMEIELLVPIGGDVQSARQRINQIATTLLGKESECVQLSYQDMLKRATAV